MGKWKWLAVSAAALAIALLCAAIPRENDRIAASLEERLLRVPLPPETERIDSKSIAGRLPGSGNGNGMQYVGLLLVVSDLSGEELQAYYREQLGNGAFVTVARQESQRPDDYGDWWFDVWTPDRPCYRIELLEESISGCEESLWEALLNLDLRGH